MKLYALLIGINAYDAQSYPQVNPLDACLNDVQAMTAFLNQHYKNLIQSDTQIKTLTNEQATRANVIKGFQEHLCQAKDDDIALVFYSGHGSYNITAPEFHGYTKDNEEQTWVLYDSRVPNNFDLADKEIALLLEDVGRQCGHIVVIADSCHSGSVTRDVEDFKQFKARYTSGRTEPRSLSTYLDGAYLSRPIKDAPHTKHILLAACDRTEKAREDGVHGIFTQVLLEVLAKTGGQLQYSELFVQARATIQGFTSNQTPQCEAQFGFNTRQGFLSNVEVEGLFKRYPIRYDNMTNRWKIGLGAEKGIQSDFGKPIMVKVYDARQEGSLIGDIKLGHIGLTESDIKDVTLLEGNRYTTYWGEPIDLPIAHFYVYADAVVSELMKSTFDAATESGIFLMSEPSICRFDLKIEAGNLMIYDKQYNNQLIQGVRGTSDASKLEVLKTLRHVARWQHILEMDNKKTRIEEKDLDMQMIITQNNQQTVLRDAVISLDYDTTPIDFKIQFANNTNKRLYVGLLHLSAAYGIDSIDENNKAFPSETELTLVKDFFRLDDDKREEVDILKLLVSTDPIDKATFSLDALEIGKIIDPTKEKAIGTRAIGGGEPDWCTKIMTIRLVRKGKNTVGASPINLGNGISLQPHPTFRSNVNKAALVQKTRSVDALVISDPYFRSNPYFQIVNLAQGTKGDDESIIEFTDIQGADGLATTPLELVINQQNTEGVILPMIYDGKNFLPFGKVEMNALGQFVCSLSHIPEDTGAIKTRNIGRALRFVFVKFINKLGIELEDIYKLRWADYAVKGTRKTYNLTEKVNTAQKVLLLVHGIIGDTKDMVTAFEQAKNKGYDLVLTYDYENLNTAIEENAQFLKEALSNLGFNKNDGKELVIVAHSMGGLIARYMIEHLHGDDFVSKLVMVGTPNGGSKLGSIPTYVNWLSMLCGASANFFPQSVASIVKRLGGFLSVTETVLLTSLAEMKIDAPFIKTLAKGTSVATPPYIVIAGNLDDFTKEDDPLRGFLEKVAIQVGEHLYANEANDIAVSIKSIFAVPALEKHEIACHHMNYFAVPKSVAALMEAIG